MLYIKLAVLFLFISGSETTVPRVNSIQTIRSTMQEDINLYENIDVAMKIAKDECRNIFKWSRWNCPESTFYRNKRNPVTKELAFAQAITSTAIAHTLTRNCSRGDIKGCGCDPSLGNQLPLRISGRDVNPMEYERSHLKNVEWSWGGCSDNVDYGDFISKNYLNEKEDFNDPKAAVHMHNNMVGREIVKSTLVKHCRCHGVSGSCSVQTCWMQVAPFPKVAKILKKRYDGALQINTDSNLNNVALEGGHQLSGIDADTLIYVDKSPNYCYENDLIGWKGTKGRDCSRANGNSTTTEEKKSCRNLCRSCGYRVRKQKLIEAVRCNCTFKWCCEVTCETCLQPVERYYCY